MNRAWLGVVGFGLVMVSSERSLATNLFEARHPSCKATDGTYQCFVLLSSGLLLQLQFALPLSLSLLLSSPLFSSPRCGGDGDGDGDGDRS